MAQEECGKDAFLPTLASATPLFRECRFTRNTALGSGGALMVQNYAEGQLEVLESLFQENYAAHYGGAIFTRQPSGVGLLVDATLVNKCDFSLALFIFVYLSQCLFTLLGTRSPLW